MNRNRQSISFVLDDEVIEINFEKQNISPTLTILNYLRSLPNHKGVKEGCAEGDCGACTVVLSEIDGNDRLIYKAVNSCLVFLPQVHGKQLITIESLAIKNNDQIQLHPVQEALIETNGSQCGYCTPGIVMSMFALYKNHDHSLPELIKDALTGNLCRCTGYQSILQATEKACSEIEEDHFSRNQSKIVSKLKEINSDGRSVQIITEIQKYFVPLTIGEALDLKQNFPKAVMVNGSTDISLRQTKKFELIPELIDLSAIAELKHYKEAQDEIIIGAGLSLETIKSLIFEKLPAFHEMLSVFASKQIRNVATLGGNLGTASPISDTLPLLMAYDSKIVMINKNGKREIPVGDFILGYRKSDLRKDELIHSCIIPLSSNRKVGFYKVSKRKDLDISSVSGGFGLELSNRIVKDICLAFGGLAAIPKRAKCTEASLLQKEWSVENIEKASQILFEEFSPISDARCSAEFRKTIARNLLLKFYYENSFAYDPA
jgi:xanthine dehydrogenase small subunit